MKVRLILLLLLISTSFAKAQVNLDSSLVLYLPFNGNAIDSSGNNNNGSVYGATLTSDKNGNANSAYYFNGISSYITVSDAATLSPAVYSISAMVQPQGFYSGNCQGNVIMWKGRDADPGHYGVIFSDNPYDNSCTIFDSLHANFYNDQGYFATTTDTPFIQSNTWYCLLSTYDGDSVRMYVDGNLRYTVHSSPSGTNPLILAIGHNPFDALFPYWYKGTMDEIRIYSRVVNNSEMNAICSLTTGVIESDPLNSITLNTSSSIGIYRLHFKNQFNNAVWSVYNLMGQKVCSQKLKNINTLTQKTIDLQQQSTGIYILKVVVDGKEINFKIIK